MVSAVPGDQIGALMHQVVPMVATLGLEYVSVTAEEAVVILRDRPEYRNHVGGPHAGAIFTVAESATGAVAIAAFADMLDRAVLLPMTATIDFMSIARGDLTARAQIEADVAQARASFDSGVRPEFDILATITTADGVQSGQVRARWTLKRLNRE